MKKLILSIVMFVILLNVINAQQHEMSVMIGQNSQSTEIINADTNYFKIMRYYTSLSETESVILDSISALFEPRLWGYQDNIVLTTKNLVEVSMKGDYPGVIIIQFDKYNGNWQLCDETQWEVYQNEGGVFMLRDLYMFYMNRLEKEELRKERQEELLSYNDTVKSLMWLAFSEKLELLINENKKSVSSDNISISYLGRYGSEFTIKVGISESYYLSGGDITIWNVKATNLDWKIRRNVHDREDFIYFVLRKTKDGWLFDEGGSYLYHHEFGLKYL